MINFDLKSAEKGKIELNIRNSNDFLLVTPSSIEVTDQQHNVELEVTFRVPDNHNSVFLDAL